MTNDDPITSETPLARFAHPDGAGPRRLYDRSGRPETADEYFARHGTAALYAWRDASLYPNKTLGEWRREIEEKLNRDDACGKIVSSQERADRIAELESTWYSQIYALPPDTPPKEIYEKAPEELLVHLGY